MLRGVATRRPQPAAWAQDTLPVISGGYRAEVRHFMQKTATHYPSTCFHFLPRVIMSCARSRPASTMMIFEDF